LKENNVKGSAIKSVPGTTKYLSRKYEREDDIFNVLTKSSFLFSYIILRKREYVESSFYVGEKNYKWAPKTSRDERLFIEVLRSWY